MKNLLYLIAGIMILWLGIGAVDDVRSVLEACQEHFADPGAPTCKVTGHNFTSIEFLRYFVLAGAVAFPSLIWFVHNVDLEKIKELRHTQ